MARMRAPEEFLLLSSHLGNRSHPSFHDDVERMAQLPCQLGDILQHFRAVRRVHADFFPLFFIQ